MLNNRFFTRLGLIAALLALCACSAKQPPLEPELDFAGNPAGEIVDLRRLPQELAAYARRVSDKPLLSAEEQDSRAKRYETLMFAPWDQTKSRVKVKDAFSIMGTRKKSTAKGYLPGKRKWPQAQWNAMVDNANRGRYPSRRDPAITVRDTYLREVPTSLPRFASPAHPTSGPPFDLFQYAALPVGMPLFISHVTRDGQWYFVENAMVGGWVASRDVALVDEAAMRTYKKGRYAAVLLDKTPLPDSLGAPYAPQVTANLGAVLPIEDMNDQYIDVLVPVRNPQGEAVLRTSRLHRDQASEVPMPLTASNVARLAEQLVNDPYGWGGYNFDRDCSSTLRDLFAPFGLWLPRNSASQAKAWTFVSLQGLTPAEKLERIKAEGRPFATLLWLPGHITLYIGQYHGEAIMFHNMWGIRTTRPGSDQSGRFVIGRAVITTTRPGTELPNIENTEGLIGSMRGMAVLK